MAQHTSDERTQNQSGREDQIRSGQHSQQGSSSQQNQQSGGRTQIPQHKQESSSGQHAGGSNR